MGANRRILIIQGHPDVTRDHLCHALAHAYAAAAVAAGHQVRTATPAQLDFPLLRSQHEWEHAPVPPGLQKAQDDIAWAEHLVLFFPLWMGDMPAILKGFLEQVARPGFAFHQEEGQPFGRKGLAGRSARVVVTMGMPALLYRYFFRAHSLKSLERNILGFVGIGPIHETLIGLVEGMDDKARAGWLARLEKLGSDGA